MMTSTSMWAFWSQAPWMQPNNNVPLDQMSYQQQAQVRAWAGLKGNFVLDDNTMKLFSKANTPIEKIIETYWIRAWELNDVKRLLQLGLTKEIFDYVIEHCNATGKWLKNAEYLQKVDEIFKTNNKDDGEQPDWNNTDWHWEPTADTQMTWHTSAKEWSWAVGGNDENNTSKTTTWKPRAGAGKRGAPKRAK